jgi:hypothetical protein
VNIHAEHLRALGQPFALDATHGTGYLDNSLIIIYFLSIGDKSTPEADGPPTLSADESSAPSFGEVLGASTLVVFEALR